MLETLKRGFTLAEVLITLLIIGVIASIVIPGIVNNTNEAEYYTSLKKIYADLSAAVKTIQANNGGTVNVGDVSGSSNVTFRDDFCNVMSCAKKDTSLNIFGSTTYKLYKGGNWATLNGSTNCSAMLNNGTLLFFGSYVGCTTNNVNACGYIYIDLNGSRGPNMIGKDFYTFWITRKNGYYSILPIGTQNDSWSFATGGGCQPNTTGEAKSQGCAAKRLFEPDSMP